MRSPSLIPAKGHIFILDMLYQRMKKGVAIGAVEVRSALICMLISLNIGVLAAKPKPTGYSIAFIGIVIYYASKCAHS